MAEFTIEVQGSCLTEYGWLRRADANTTGTLDKYVFFNDESNTLLVAGPNTTTPDLAFFALVDQSQAVQLVLNTTNQTYALVTTTAAMGSFTPSSDPWYLTEVATGGLTPKTFEASW